MNTKSILCWLGVVTVTTLSLDSDSVERKFTMFSTSLLFCILAIFQNLKMDFSIILKWIKVLAYIVL